MFNNKPVPNNCMIGGLEELVSAKAELSLAIDALKLEDGALNVDAPSKVESADEERISDSLDEDSLSSLVEQELDPASYEHQEYTLGVYGDQKSYEYVKDYTEPQSKDNEVSYTAEVTEHEVLKTFQEATNDAKDAALFNEVNLSKIDDDWAHQVSCFKVMYGQYMSFLMYKGEILFN